METKIVLSKNEVLYLINTLRTSDLFTDEIAINGYLSPEKAVTRGNFIQCYNKLVAGFANIIKNEIEECKEEVKKWMIKTNYCEY